MTAVFMIINRSDPIYEAEFSPPSSSASSSSSSSGPYLFLNHATLVNSQSCLLYFLPTSQPIHSLLLISVLLFVPVFVFPLALAAQYSTSYLSQFVIHSSLDMIDTKMWTHRWMDCIYLLISPYPSAYSLSFIYFPSSNFLGEINFFNRPTSVVSAYVTPGMHSYPSSRPAMSVSVHA